MQRRLLAILALVAACSAPTAPVEDAGPSVLAAVCPTVILTGTQKVFDTRKAPLAACTLLKASGATWTAMGNNPINWAGRPRGLWLGGTVIGKWNQATTPWSSYHSTAGMHARVDTSVVEGLRVHNYGDGIRFMEPSTKAFVLRGAWFSDIHDDGVENDLYKTGLVEDSFLDGVYVAFSGRPAAATYQTIDGSKITYTIRNNVVRLKAFALTAKAPNTSGGFFKIENRLPARNMKWVVEGNVFRADGRPGTGTLCLNQHGKFTARNNILVWRGTGNFPCTLPPGWTLTRDIRVWDAAVAAWKARH